LGHLFIFIRKVAQRAKEVKNRILPVLFLAHQVGRWVRIFNVGFLFARLLDLRKLGSLRENGQHSRIPFRKNAFSSPLTPERSSRSEIKSTIKVVLLSLTPVCDYIKPYAERS
jgi:hypothetical protein